MSPVNDPTDVELDVLRELARAGSVEGLQHLLEAHRPLLLAVVRRVLAKRTRLAVDSTDVLQDIALALLKNGLPDEVYRTREALLAYLRKIAENAARRSNEFHLATEKRSLWRQQPLDATSERHEFIDRSCPTLAYEFQDAWEKFLQALPPLHRSVARLIGAGHTEAEVAARLEISTRMVSRVLERLQERCSAWVESPAAVLMLSRW